MSFEDIIFQTSLTVPLQANVDGWTGSSTNSGTGNWGSCCDEMDVWEANNVATAYTPHPCTPDGLYRCSGASCSSTCDQAGCDFNSYRMGNTTFYGAGLTVDTTKTFTVVTQFLTVDGTSTGTLKEIRRLYVQGGKVIQNTKVNIPGMAAYDSVSDTFCSAQKTAFSDGNDFAARGGLTKMGKAFDKGMVLVMSVWDDYAANMLWLDSSYPLDLPASNPGVTRGTCATTSGAPADVESQQANASVTFSNIKFGDLGSTYPGGTAPNTSTTTPGITTTSTKPITTTTPLTTSTRTTSTTTSRTSTAATPGATLYGQCGGKNWAGPTTCAQGTCKFSNEWYSKSVSSTLYIARVTQTVSFRPMLALDAYRNLGPRRIVVLFERGFLSSVIVQIYAMFCQTDVCSESSGVYMYCWPPKVNFSALKRS